MAKDFKLNRALKKFIEENDKKPTAVADRAGIRRDVFSRILNSKRPIYADEVPDLCSALGVSVETLFDGISTEGGSDSWKTV